MTTTPWRTSIAVGAVVLVAASASAAGYVLDTSYVLEFNSPLYNPCSGEVIQFSGSVRFHDHLVVDAHGGVHFNNSFTNQGVSGVAEGTGVSYQAVGHSSSIANLMSASEYTVNNEFRLVGQGPGNNYKTTYVVHVTITPAGETAATIERFEFVCS